MKSFLFILIISIFFSPVLYARPLFDNSEANSVIIPRMIVIPGGCFQMGSSSYELNRGRNESRHRVCIKQFQMAEREVTVGEFRRFVQDTHYITDAEINFIEKGCWSFDEKKHRWGWLKQSNWKKPLPSSRQDEHHPVTCVSYYDIQEYIAWLNKKTGEHYRLPTEAEWEYAARAGSTGLFFWGNHPDLACRYANMADLTATRGFKWPLQFQCIDHYVFAAPVKTFLPNKFGLYDMLGNVWEWSCSQYESDYQGQEQKCVEGKRLSADDFIAVRGGGWNAGPDRSRLAYRNWESPWVRMSTWGFRLVKERYYRRRPVSR